MEVYGKRTNRCATALPNGAMILLFPRPMHIPAVGLSTIALMIENVVGLEVSLPRKTVRWIVPTLENMGIENFNLRRNTITILSQNSGRGWEIRHESGKALLFHVGSSWSEEREDATDSVGEVFDAGR